MLMTLACFLALVGACGSGSGSCVVESSTGRSGWESCYDDYSVADCDEKKETLDLDAQHSPSPCDSGAMPKNVRVNLGLG